MSRRPKKSPNKNFSPHNPYPGSWQSTNFSVHDDWTKEDPWANLGESFWGGNNPSSRQNRQGKELWRPGDRGRNKPSGREKSSGANQEKYPWSTLKVKTKSGGDSNEASATAGLQNGTTSSPSNKGDTDEPPSTEKSTTFKEIKNLRQEQNKQLMIGLRKPVECSIAERMMQKMGWQGGGLGVKEEGRTEPVEVNLNFINKTTGLGHIEKKQKQPKIPQALQKFATKPKVPFPLIPVIYLQPIILDPNQKQEKKNKKVKKQFLTKKELKKARRNQHETIDIDVLDTILDFVMDVKQIEYGFDLNYSKKERRIIHNFVQYLREGVNEEVIFDFDELHLSKIVEINEYNNYVLMTESQGVHPNRQLFIFKEAPDGVYLVTRDDLIEDKEDSAQEVIDDSNKNHNDIAKAEADDKITAKNIDKTPSLKKDSKSEVKSDFVKDLKVKSTEIGQNTIVHSILTELMEIVPSISESQMSNDSKLNKSDNDDKMKNKHTVADFIENCSKDLNKDVERTVLDTTNINEANLLKNNLKTHDNHSNETTQDNKSEEIPEPKDANEIKNDIIEIDLTDSKNTPVTEPNTSIKSPKIQETNDKTSKINEEINESDTENNLSNNMDVELEKIRGQPKLVHLESALYIYLHDFLKHDVYTEMRFLGDFGDAEEEEKAHLDKLLDSICEVSDRTKNYNDSSGTVNIYKELYNNETYYLQMGQDCNGGEVIYKILRNWENED